MLTNIVTTIFLGTFLPYSEPRHRAQCYYTRHQTFYAASFLVFSLLNECIFKISCCESVNKIQSLFVNRISMIQVVWGCITFNFHAQVKITLVVSTLFIQNIIPEPPAWCRYYIMSPDTGLPPQRNNGPLKHNSQSPREQRVIMTCRNPCVDLVFKIMEMVNILQ